MLSPQAITSVARRLGTSPDNVRNGQAGEVYCHPAVTGADVLDNGMIVTVSNPAHHTEQRCSDSAAPLPSPGRVEGELCECAGTINGTMGQVSRCGRKGALDRGGC